MNLLLRNLKKNPIKRLIKHKNKNNKNIEQNIIQLQLIEEEVVEIFSNVSKWIES